jgi:hypothetical protein
MLFYLPAAVVPPGPSPIPLSDPLALGTDRLVLAQAELWHQALLGWFAYARGDDQQEVQGKFFRRPG